MARPEAKGIRWNLRVAGSDDDLVRSAATASERNLSEFVIQAATAEAERVLADRTRFVLDNEQWEQFVKLLDRPATADPRLSKLFSTPPVFD